MTNSLNRRVLGAAVLALSVVVWGYGLQWAALLNFVTGPVNGVLSARAAVLLRGDPGRRGTRLLAIGLYVTVLMAAVGILASGVAPIAADGFQPSFATVFLGVHGEGLLGSLGLLAGAITSLLSFRGSGAPANNVLQRS